jgi:hypothetical protein
MIEFIKENSANALKLSGYPTNGLVSGCLMVKKVVVV